MWILSQLLCALRQRRKLPTGTFRTFDFQDSCFPGSFEAPQLARDPNVTALSVGGRAASTGSPSLSPTVPGDALGGEAFDFEAGMGDWSDLSDLDAGNRPWARGFSSTPSNPTGPQGGDHTFGTGSNKGHFAFVETSGSNSPNVDNFILGKAVAGGCGLVSFWYNMYGSNMGSMDFEISTNGGSTWRSLWSKEGNQGTEWQLCELKSIDDPDVTHVRFRGKSGSGFLGDSAVDDVSVGRATTPAPTATPPPTAQATPLPEPNLDGPLVVAATGRTPNGGLLHPAPFSTAIEWGSDVALGTAEAEGWFYEAYCAAAAADPDETVGGVAMVLKSCASGAGVSGYKQRLKFGYDWRGSWDTPEGIAADEVWTNALDPGSSEPAWGQPLTIVLAWKPVYCLDACANDVASGECAFEEGDAVYMNTCEEIETVDAPSGFTNVRPSQRWFWRPKGSSGSGEVVNSGAADTGSAAQCLGWPSEGISEEAGLLLKPCGVGTNTLFNEEFYRQTQKGGPVHGAFYFDPYRNYLERNPEVTVSPFGGMLDYTVWNTSVLSVVVAGNSSLSIMTESCPVEGCTSFAAPEVASVSKFQWSDSANWVRLNTSAPCDHKASLTHMGKLCSGDEPCSCGDVTIESGWTVVLDETTPFLNTLTIKGTLIVPYNWAGAPLSVHANFINVKGGRFLVGNETHPYTGPTFSIVLHGDLYLHGKECTSPTDTYVSSEGCWKAMAVNGDLSLHGSPVPKVTVKLGKDAWKGETQVTLSSAVTAGGGWVAGAEVMVGSAKAPEFKTLAAVSSDGMTLTFSSSLASSKIGTATAVSDAGAGLAEAIDGRAWVSLLSRNIEVRGGYHAVYDYVSGVGPDLTDYGATIRTQGAFDEAKAGWTKDMVGYEVFGVNRYPDGQVLNMAYVRFVSCGKQYGPIKPGLTREPPLVIHAGITDLKVVGVVVTDPMAGHFFECTNSPPYRGAYAACSVGHVNLQLLDNVFVGTSVDFDPGSGKTHTANNNVWVGGVHCRIGCPNAKMVVLGNDDPKTAGGLAITNNLACNGYGGFTLKAPCANYEAANGGAWHGNLALGNTVGYDVAAGCRALKLVAFRNAAGVTAATDHVTNFVVVENGVGVAAGSWNTWPDACKQKPPDNSNLGKGLPLISGGVVVGRTPHVAGSVRSTDCSGHWSLPTMGGYHLGGIMAG